MEKTEEVRFNDTDKAIASFIYSSIFVVGTSGNLIVLISILFRREARKQQSNIFLASLSLTDLLTSTICGPYYLRSLYVTEFISKEGTKSWLCSTMMVTMYLLAIESILSLGLISLDRFFAIRKPFWYQRNVTQKSCLAVVCFSWIYGTIIVTPPVFKSGWIIYENFPGSPCGFQWQKANKVYLALSFAISFVLPAIAICITNALVFKTAQEQNRKIKVHVRIKRKSHNVLGPNRVSSNAIRTAKVIATDASIYNKFERVFLDDTAALHTNRNFEQTLPCNLLLRPSSVSCMGTTEINSTSRSKGHSGARTHSLNDIAELQIDGKVMSKLSSLARHLDHIEARGKHLLLENVLQTSLMREVDSTKYNIPSITQPLNQLYHDSESNLEVLSRKPKGKAEDSKMKPAMKCMNKATNNRKVKISPKKEMKLVLATISISVAFFISWIPFVIPRFLQSVGVNNVSGRALNYGTIFAMMSSAWNPYIIVLTRKEILEGFKTVMKRLQKNIFHRKVLKPFYTVHELPYLCNQLVYCNELAWPPVT